MYEYCYSNLGAIYAKGPLFSVDDSCCKRQTVVLYDDSQAAQRYGMDVNNDTVKPRYFEP